LLPGKVGKNDQKFWGTENNDVDRFRHHFLGGGLQSTTGVLGVHLVGVVGNSKGDRGKKGKSTTVTGGLKNLKL